MPLEIFGGNKIVDVSIDSWAIGIIACQLRNSNSFFHTPNTHSSYQNLLRKCWSISQELKRFVNNNDKQGVDVANFVAKIRRHCGNVQEIWTSPLLEQMLKDYKEQKTQVIDIAQVYAEIYRLYIAPTFSKTVFQKLLVNLTNDPYDRMIKGLLSTNEKERISLQQALDLLS